MKQLVTPILIKTNENMPLPPREDIPVFYVLASNGLYMVRQHRMFTSCVKTSAYPSELEEQDEFLVPNFPKIPKKLFLKIVSFFYEVAHTKKCEVCALFIWDDEKKKVFAMVPEQEVTSPGLAIENYFFPTDLPSHQSIIGDIHSHVFCSAYASSVDEHDELHQAGMHFVVGGLDKFPTDLHIECVADEARFILGMDDAVEDFSPITVEDLIAFPKEWMKKIKIVKSKWSSTSYFVGGFWDRKKEEDDEKKEKKNGAYEDPGYTWIG